MRGWCRREYRVVVVVMHVENVHQHRDTLCTCIQQRDAYGRCRIDETQRCRFDESARFLVEPEVNKHAQATLQLAGMPCTRDCLALSIQLLQARL